MMRTEECTEKCYAMPKCGVCGQVKKPHGRSAPLGTIYCDHECPGYMQEPLSGHLWYSEREEANDA